MSLRPDLADRLRLLPLSAETTALDNRLPVAAARGMDVYIAQPPKADLRELVERATQLAAAGFTPVPHLVARAIKDRPELRMLLRRLRGEANVERALLVGGDLEHPAGDYESALSLLESGLFAELGFTSVGFATYPEKHRRIGQHQLHYELELKLSSATRQGLGAWLVTQFSFDAQAIAAHLVWLRERDIQTRVLIGVAGPTSVRSLARFAQLCGVRASIGFLGAHAGEALKLIAAYDPARFVASVAEEALRDEAAGPVGLHLFSFGGIERTTQWLDELGLLDDVAARARLDASPHLASQAPSSDDLTQTDGSL